MKRLVIFLMFPVFAYGQTQEAAQLLLNYEKLKQLEEILDNMYKGYKILTQGYNRIKGIAEGNYKLHQVFLDGLLSVSPTVRKYKRIPQIISYQQLLMKEYRRAFNRFKDDDNLTPQEIRYITNVYEHLVKRSLKNLEELTLIITASQLRMSDDERLMAIDRIYFDIVDKASFLRHFNNSTQMLIIQRAKEKSDVDAVRKLNTENN
ncbi:TerB family tellurite resistance protein [Chryseosolibacter indicus]|uniref:TerB family tellurite resistance protein n=1 Tax=Chryseosolibacter indicus TaxID=2782351 RepID=A0ABS5VZQ2_9BACT|nr:TerB family tellurite resistance protein [Chryseosolibacter indicus]MBT1706340.1 TerB family tellurite resistance protein [Chryseosolibacter indicus]